MRKILTISLLLVLFPIYCPAQEIIDAARADDLDRIKAIIDADPEAVNMSDGRSCTPLHYASDRGNVEIVSYLLEKGADISARDVDGDTPLHWAAYTNRVEVAELLIAKGSDIEATNNNGDTAFDYALRRGSKEVVALLIEKGFKIVTEGERGRNLLFAAAEGGHEALVDLLIAKGVDRTYVNARGETLLHKAAAGGLNKLVESELARGVDINARMYGGETPLYRAAGGGHLDTVKLLVESGADPGINSRYNVTILQSASYARNVDLIKYLLDLDIDPNCKNFWNTTPLFGPIQRGSTDIAKLLVSHGVKVTARDDYGETPVSWAAVFNSKEILEFLWPLIPENEKKVIGEQALTRASEFGNAEIVEYLLSNGIDVNSSIWTGASPLHAAARGGQKDAAEFLLNKGAKIDSQDKAGRTPLHEAAISGNLELAKLLLEKKSNLNEPDNDGNTPLQLAIEYGKKDVADYLKESGATVTKDYASLLEKRLEDGEAIIWHLGHSGWAIKTKSNLLVFDYTGMGGRSESPSIANGRIVPDELADQNVIVFVTHAHGDHYNPAIMNWEKTIRKIRYVFGWKAFDDPKHIYLDSPRSKTTIDGVEIFTIYDHHETVPEIAFLIKVDDLTIYFSGDYLGYFEEDFDYFASISDDVDLAFSNNGGNSTFLAAEKFNAKVLLPMHAYPFNFTYEGFAHYGQSRIKNTVIMPAAHLGDRFHFKEGKIRQLLVKHD